MTVSQKRAVFSEIANLDARIWMATGDLKEALVVKSEAIMEQYPNWWMWWDI